MYVVIVEYFCFYYFSPTLWYYIIDIISILLSLAISFFWYPDNGYYMCVILISVPVLHSIFFIILYTSFIIYLRESVASPLSRYGWQQMINPFWVNIQLDNKMQLKETGYNLCIYVMLLQYCNGMRSVFSHQFDSALVVRFD